MQIQIAGLKIEKTEPKEPLKEHPVLFIHGSGLGAWTWENYIHLFSSRGYTCYAPNLRGQHGSKSVSHIGRISIHEHISDLSEMFEVLRDPILIGHSMGGLICQKLAELFNPHAVITLAPAAPRGIFALKSPALFLMAIKHLPEILQGRPIIPSKGEAFRMILNRIPVSDQERLYDQLLPQSGRLMLEIALFGLPVDGSKVHVPMLVIGASEDRLTPPHVVRKIAKKYQAEIREYAGFAHMLILEPGWEKITRDIVHWLEGVIKKG